MSALALFLFACKPDVDLTVTDRAAGDRTPLSASCDPLDEVRCHLPWPSSTFTAVDSSTETGLRLAIDPSALESSNDDPSFVNLADGFSRVTPLAAGFHARLDSATFDGAVALVVASPDHPAFGALVPVWEDVVSTGIEDTPVDMLMAYPNAPLDPDTDYAVAITGTLRDVDGAPVPRERASDVALGLADPETREEADIAGYYAPTRAALEAAGLEMGDLSRIWEFTTRSREDPLKRLWTAMELADEALNAGEIEVEIFAAAEDSDERVLRIVRGYLKDLPSFFDEDGYLVLDDQGYPQLTGTRDVEFRVAIPAGDGDWPVALYGHGTGGDVTDSSFDEELTGAGMGKVAGRWLGWNGEDLVLMLAGMANFFQGSYWSTSALVQSLADFSAILTALEGPLGDALAAETLMGEPNPAAGRYPDAREPIWMGGSHGGMMGAIMVPADSRIRYGVLNVPGGGWSVAIPRALYYDVAVRGIIEEAYGGEIDAQLVLAMSQPAWDDVDGSIWAEVGIEDGGMFLLQESMNDPVMPNEATNSLASALGATLMEPYIEAIEGLESHGQPITSGAALTQFAVPDEGEYEVHGFAARDTPAGAAAFAQIQAFVESALAGTPVITFPAACAQDNPAGDCDYSEAWPIDGDPWGE